MMDRGDDEHAREAAGGALAQDEHHHPYEPPTLTTLGSVAELTKLVKGGSQVDPGDGFQAS